MINKIFRLFNDGFRYIQEHPQLLFTLLLIIVIPTAFLFSGQQFLDASRKNQELLEKNRIGLMQDVFISLVEASSNNVELLQNQITELARLNPDITKFRLTTTENGELTPFAALNPVIIGLPEPNPEAYLFARIRPDESIINQFVVQDVRHWQAIRVFEIEGQEMFILTEISLAGTDSVFAQREIIAYYWLFGLLAVVLLLVLRHVRLIDYGYLYRETKHANEMKDLFTNMIAHELRAPLTAMRGYASMIRENDTVDNTVREQAHRIEESSERLVIIVSDLLDVARIQSGKLSVIKEQVDVSDVVVSATEALASSAQKKNIELVHEGTHNKHMVISDAKRLHQAVTNLISNAIKYTSEGRIEVSVDELKDRVELRVKDTGMGISAEDQKKLFAPFFRVKSRDVSEITGTGLGMWITKQLIELLGASVGVESIKGVGTHIVVTLPKSQ